MLHFGSPRKAEPVFPAPEDVPARVSEEQLLLALRSLRPAGKEREVSVDGVRCPMVEQGKGQDLLLVHGLGHDLADFTPLFEQRPEGFHLIALDLPGFGLSDKPRRDYPLRLLTDAVLAAAQRAKRPPVVVASSLGGHVAMLAALEEPDAFAGLVLLAPGGLSRTPLAVQAIARTYYSFDAICARRDDEVVTNSRRIFRHESAARERIAARKLAIHRSAQKEAFAWSFARVVDDVFRNPVAERLADIRVPRAIVFGEHDPIVSPTEGRIAADRAKVPFQRMPGLGHLPMLEDPEAFARVVLPLARSMGASS